MASSSTTQTKTSGDHQNESKKKSDTTHESNKVTSTNYSGTVKDRPVEPFDLSRASAPADCSRKHSPHLFQKGLFSSFGAAPIKSSFFPTSNRRHRHAARSDVLHAQPFDEFAIAPSDSDTRGGTSTKPDGNGSPWTDKKS